MKPEERGATAASYRRYVIGYALFILFRSWLMFTNPKPIRVSTVIAMIGFVLIILFMISRSWLRVQYGLLILGIIVIELIARDTGIKPLFLVEAALAAVLAILAFRKKELPA
jgi:hypothetical protein